jgi:hypothetical protein
VAALRHSTESSMRSVALVVAGTYLLIFEIAHRDGYMRPSLVSKINIDPLLHLDVPPYEKCLKNASSLAHMVDTCWS